MNTQETASIEFCPSSTRPAREPKVFFFCRYFTRRKASWVPDCLYCILKLEGNCLRLFHEDG